MSRVHSDDSHAKTQADKALIVNFEPEDRDTVKVSSDAEDFTRDQCGTSTVGKAATFGLIADNPKFWDRFQASISNLQENAPGGESYKVFFLGRHGLAKHNWLAPPPGPPETAREDKLNLLDPELTELGEGQARAVNSEWKRNSSLGAPRPDLWLCSPLTRTAQTLRLSFESLLGHDRPIFVEALREILHERPCNKRRSKTYLQNNFPECDFEEGFSEEDTTWRPDGGQETEAERRTRLREAMCKIFEERDETYISITSHNFALSSLLMVLHHERHKFQPGEVLVVVVKGVRNGGRSDHKSREQECEVKIASRTQEQSIECMIGGIS
ncbi:hypothetical protein QFC21_000422 [Naganishia friedmannii]|uniref:Uncharacterized protein n=1 Tax=Naganishia friedmannii TaxID=89922 RepID=A0ACC2WD23_9TREE|nr:hypothetical protein QFC21_000422 [Naganishia friedmannii]